jgi:hypothetical protein
VTDNDLEPPARLPWSERPGASVIVAGGTLGGTALGSLTAAVWIGASFARAESGGFDATYSIMGTLFAAAVGGFIGCLLGSAAAVAGVLVRIPFVLARRGAGYQATAVGIGGAALSFLGGLLIAPFLGWTPWLTGVAFAIFGGSLLGLLAFVDARRTVRPPA